MKRQHQIGMIAVVVGTLLLGSCVERKESGMLNPDGSGKAVVDVYKAAPNADAVAFGKQYAAEMIKHTQGAEAWKDIAIEAAPDGRAHVTAVVYFADISKFRLDPPFTTIFTKNDDGTYTFAMQKEEPASQPIPPKMTDEQVRQAIATARANYKQQQPAMQLLLNNLKVESSFELPGSVTATSIFSKSGEDRVTLAIDGKQVIAAMDKIMADDNLLAGAIKNGTTPAESDALLLESLFGKKGPVSATVTGPLKVLFDYRAEADAAKSGEAEMLKKAGVAIQATTMPAPTQPTP